ncbi:NADH-cytochrome b5 reductase [Talaromyces stipitatus ATCC 10500]|uniref:NADH-cytochrome b5 reductase n=1 Tax=Talaromyces stipitatus (strain ATCC 10500 / CBS 375.48 / QM 6759 / NRRL 1006) TaxID=441959 RepID=B8M5H0_TALSN|nr:NADH-cytochrome b5 reductase [Talaromyces stipitatus ATCC 10500]EED19776.1 NADH-cytochrome b5 reductase [Talaromyces stipitatus ATCC 10500]
MSSPLSSETLSGVLVPSALLIAGTFFVKQEWVPYAVAVAAVFSAFRILTARPRKVLNPKEFQDFVLKEKNLISHNVAIYRFALPRSTDILGLPIGQHISLQAQIAGNPTPVVRSYTPISSDHEAGYFDLLVKTYPQGNISKYLDELKIGQTMKVRGPKGAMVYTPNMSRHIGMIAGGTGITPMLQIIKAIIRGRPRNGGNDTTKIDLIFANVNPEDILLKDELDKLAAEDDQFNIYYVLNNPPEGWKGGVGFVTADMIKEHLPAPADDVKVLLCGPPPMISAMKKTTEALGYKKASPVSKLHDQVFAF